MAGIDGASSSPMPLKSVPPDPNSTSKATSGPAHASNPQNSQVENGAKEGGHCLSVKLFDITPPDNSCDVSQGVSDDGDKGLLNVSLTTVAAKNNTQKTRQRLYLAFSKRICLAVMLVIGSLGTIEMKRYIHVGS